MPRAVLGIPEDLSHGPLDEGRARVDCMRACLRGHDDGYLRGLRRRKAPVSVRVLAGLTAAAGKGRWLADFRAPLPIGE